jgi:hypothetical protein
MEPWMVNSWVEVRIPTLWKQSKLTVMISEIFKERNEKNNGGPQ